MGNFGCDLVKQYVERLINRAKTEVRHVFCFTSIVNELEEERATLEPLRMTMRQRVIAARQRDKDVTAAVTFWEEEVDKLYEVDTKTNETCFFGFCTDCVWRYKKGKELATSTEQIKLLKQKEFFLEDIELPRRLPEIERYSSNHYISFASRESTYKELLNALIGDNNYIIGLHGMGGSGKTTLVREVGKKLKQSKQFSSVIDIKVSSTPNIHRIQDDIAGPLGLKLEDCNESDRPRKLWSRLTNGEKILLIMDDVWDGDPPLDFEAIGIPKWDNHKGCRVLVISGSKQIFNKMGCDKRIEVELLSEEDAWIMFERYAGISNSSSKRVIGMGREIAKECKQLPVAIAVIARRLKGQELRFYEWDVTLNSLKNRASISTHYVDEYMAVIYKALKFSYDYITDEKAKGLFLLCSLFRENEEISIEVLTRFIIGAGLFEDHYGNYNGSRNRVSVAKKKLLDHHLLLEVDEKHVKMHDLVRAMAQWIVNKEIQGVNSSKPKQKYLSCEGKDMDLFSCKFDSSNLETLIVKVDSDKDCKFGEVPNSFFENIVKLRVLYFSGNDGRPLSLREYIFPFLFVRDLPVLETIKIRRCDGLKYIFGQYQHEEFGSLRELELSQLPKFIDMFCKSNHPISLSEKGSSSTSNYGSKAQLQLDLDPMKFNIFSWDTTATTISLVDGQHLESNSYRLNIWERSQCLQIPSTILYNIKKIELSHFPKIRSVFIPSIASRMLLETLTIKNCAELKNIIDFGDYESGGSNNWGNVFPNMKDLYIKGCPKMDYVFGHKPGDHQNHVEIQLHLQELKCLSLCNLQSLVAMCPKNYRIKFPPLAKLEHNNCSPAAVKSLSHFIIDPVSESLDSPIIQGVEITVEEGSTSTNANTITSATHLELEGSSSLDDDCDGEIAIPFPMATIEPLATHYVVDDENSDENLNLYYALNLEMLRRFDHGLQNETDLETTEDFAAEVEVQAKAGQMLQLCLPFQDIEISVEEGITSNYEKTKDGDSQITLPSPPIATIEPLTPPNIDVENSNGSISLNDDAVVKVASTIEEQFPYDDDDEVIVSKSRFSSIGSQFPSKGFQDGTEVQATSEHILTSSHENDIDSSTPGSGTKMKQTAEGDQDFIENVSDLKIASNSEVLMNGQTTSVLGEIDTTITTSQEDGDGKISIPSFSAVNTKPPATKYVDIGDSQKTVAMEDINKLIEEDPLRALATLEKLLTGQVSISSFRVLLQELKTLMDSSSELDHLVSNQESISKLNSPFHRLNQHPGMLTSDMKDFVEKVQNFFNENIIKHTTSQQVLKKHNQLLYSKTDLMNKLWSVKSTQTHIDTETSTTNAQIHLQIDEQRTKLADHENQRDGLKSVLNKFDVQKMKLKAECTELAQQSKKFLSALASSEVDVREAERVRNSANEGFANLKSSFPTF